MWDQGRSEDVGEPAGPGVRGAAGAPEGAAGFDFTGYKRSSLMRRVDRRMSQVGIADYAEYLDYLEVHPDEFTALFNTILINVTGFFRDAGRLGLPRGRRSCPRCSPAKPPGRSRCGSGAPAAPPARRPTPSPWCWPSCSGSDEFRRPGQDLRHRRRRGGARPGAAGRLHRARASQGVPAELLDAVLRADRRPLRLPQGPAPLGDLRPQRPGAGRADLPDRPAGLPQHADVLQRRDAGADPQPVPLRARPTAACCSSARPRCCSATATLFTPVDLKRRIFRKVARATCRERPCCSASARRAVTARSRPAWTTLRNEALLASPARPGRGHRATGWWRWPTSRPSSLFGVSATRRRPPVPRPRRLLPPGGAAPPHRAGPGRAPHRAGHRRGS